MTWTTAFDDSFDDGVFPAHWLATQYPYSTPSWGYCLSSHAFLRASSGSDGATGHYMVLKNGYEASGPSGARWYQGRIVVANNAATNYRAFPYVANNQRVTTRMRVESQGLTSHRNLPLLAPVLAAGVAYKAGYGEDDCCETEGALAYCHTFLHYDPTAPGGSLTVSSPQLNVDLTAWHTFVYKKINHTVTVTIDGTIVWTYTGNSTTLPDISRLAAFQQELLHFSPNPTLATNLATDHEELWIDSVKLEAA